MRRTIAIFAACAAAIASFGRQVQNIAPEKAAEKNAPAGAMTCRDLACRMPAQVEGLLAVDIVRAASKESKVAQLTQRWSVNPFTVYFSEAKDDVFRRLTIEVRDNPVLLFAIAGAKFTVPYDIGVGRFDRMLVVRFERSVKAAVEKARAGNIEGLVLVAGDGPPIWKGSSAMQMGEYNRQEHPQAPVVDEYVAFPDEHTIVISRSLEMAAGLVARWDKPGTHIPRQWSIAAEGIDLGAPLIVLRRFDPTDTRDCFSPFRPGYLTRETAQIGQIAATVPSEKERTLTVRASTHDADHAEAWLRSAVKGIGDAVGPSVKRSDGIVEITTTAEEKRVGEFFLLLRAFSGPNFAI